MSTMTLVETLFVGFHICYFWLRYFLQSCALPAALIDNALYRHYSHNHHSLHVLFYNLQSNVGITSRSTASGYSSNQALPYAFLADHRRLGSYNSRF